MKKDIKFKALVGGAIAFLLLVLVGLSVVAHQNRAREEIAHVNDMIALDAFDQDDISSLTTKKARNHAEVVLEEYTEMVSTYPLPKIVLIRPIGEGAASSELLVETKEENITYLIQFKTTDAETASIKWIDGLSRERSYSLDPVEGLYSYEVPLDQMKNTFSLEVKNKYKEASFSVVITREETKEERDLRLAAEASERAAVAEIEAANRAWEQSEAGQICSRHAEWSENECTKLADGKYWMGMSYDMLIELRGQPNSANPSNYGYGTEWQWCWWYHTPSCFYDDNDDGFVDSFN